MVASYCVISPFVMSRSGLPAFTLRTMFQRGIIFLVTSLLVLILSGPTVIVGDFNTVFDRAIDRMGSVVGDVSRESSVALGRLFSDVCCIDI